MYDIIGYEGAYDLSYWCTGISLNEVYFGALFPHEK